MQHEEYDSLIDWIHRHLMSALIALASWELLEFPLDDGSDSLI